MTYSGRIKEAKALIAEVLKTHTDVCVGYSGGKDSSLLLELVLRTAIEDGHKNIFHVLYIDTLVDNVTLTGASRNTLALVQHFFKQQRLYGSSVNVLTPPLKNTFWSLLIGKGYPLPHRHFRWCQSKLKIRPAEAYMKTLEKKGPLAVLLGHRRDESQERAKALNNGNDLKRSLPTYAPLAGVIEGDVWEYLVAETPIWEGDFNDVVRLYRDARGECPLIPDASTKLSSKGCGSRFGCWVCTLVKEDKSMANQSKADKALLPYLEFRQWLIDFVDNTDNRNAFGRLGGPAKGGKGCIKIDARKVMLQKLMKLQAMTGTVIITDAEIGYIKQCWTEDQGSNQRRGAQFTANLKRDRTEGKIIAAVKILESRNHRPTQAKVAEIVGITQSLISKRYAHLLP